MTEQKTLTSMEAIEEARKGAVITLTDVAQPMFFKNHVVKYENGFVVNLIPKIIDGSDLIVTPAPKPKVKVALYAYTRGTNRWRTTSDYYKDDNDFKDVVFTDVKFKRLNWSEMEVEG